MLQYVDKDLEEGILKELSVAEAFKHVEWLAKNCPQRLSGSEEARVATDYILEVLKRYDAPAVKHEFDAFVCFPKNPDWSGTLELRSPEKKPIRCVVRAQIASTPPEGIEAEVVYAGSGFEEDYVGQDVRGKISLVDVGGVSLLGDRKRHISRYEQYKIAREKGAVAQIQIGYGDVLQLGSVKDAWGNPTPQAMQELPAMPAVGVSSEDGELLEKLCDKSKVRVWMKAEVWRGWTRVFEPAAEIVGSRWPEQHLLIGAHMDAWGGGVTCNATGIALLLELARVLTRRRKDLKRTLKLAWWPGHETGTFAGSMWYVDNHWDDVKNNMIAHINCDSPGLSQSVAHRSLGSAEIRRFQDTVLNDVGIERRGRKIVRKRPAAFGDFPCFLYGPGVPIMYDRGDYNENKDWWWYHSAADTFEKADKDVFLQELQLYATYAVRLLNAEIFPFEFVSVSEEFLKTLLDLNEKGGRAVGLEELVGKTQKLKDYASKLDRQLAELPTDRKRSQISDRVNRLMMKLSRALNNVNYSVSDRYSHDPYSIAQIILPGLDSIRELARMNPQSDGYKALKTELIRQKNRVSDALALANELLLDAIQIVSV